MCKVNNDAVVMAKSDINETQEIWSAVQIIWKAIKEEIQNYKETNAGLILHEDRYDRFNQLFKEKYKDIMERFMQESTMALDSHKQAALITICCLESNIIEHQIDDGEQITIVPELIAINVGLSYMKDRLNEILEKKKIDRRIEKYYLPVALACETPYIEIMSRLLYYEKTEDDMSYNIMELADKYFLIEYINLLQHGIEPYKLK